MKTIGIRLSVLSILAIVALGTTPARADVITVEYGEFRDPGARAERVEQVVAAPKPARTVYTTSSAAPKAERRQRRWFHLGK